MTHRLPEQLLARPVNVHIVGCGGTGSAIAGGLPYLHQSIVARGHPYGLTVTLQDGDTVSEANCVRQPFCRGEVGYPKSTVLASRMNLFWGFQWQSVPAFLTKKDRLTGCDIVIGCVDSRKARALIADLATQRHAHVAYWLDLGNLAEEGQYVLGQPLNAANKDLQNRLPTAAELWPEIVATKAAGPNLPSCSAAEALTRQAPFVNQVLANHALSMLAKLFAGGIEYHGGFVNLATGKASSIPVPEPAPQTKLKNRPPPRKSRRKKVRV